MLKSGVATVLGTMSGTSLDGVDAAVIRTDGERIIDFGPSRYRPYSAAERATLSANLGRWPSDDVSAAAKVVEDTHIAVMSGFKHIDLAGFHGQTLAHDPAHHRTHQCGNGARLADALGVPVVWDFRSEDMRRGGQGAPLAPFYHFALARWIGANAPIAFVNLGGVGNITWVDPSHAGPDEPGALLAFDTGPANAPINDAMSARLGQAFDDGGALAATGQADAAIVSEFLTHPYFDQAPPKSLDRDDFDFLTDAVAKLDDADAIATLTQIAVAGVVRALSSCPMMPETLLITGGGRRNQTIMAGLRAALACQVKQVEDVGLDGDMLEAQAFAYLAVRAARGMAISAPGTTGVSQPVSGAILSDPRG